MYFVNSDFTAYKVSMDEPLKKKYKAVTTNYEVDEDLGQLEDILLKSCLCSLSNETLHRILSWFHCADIVASWPLDRTLRTLSNIQLLCDIIILQFTKGSACPRIIEIRHLIIQTEWKFVNFIMKTTNIEDEYVLYAACNALTSLLLIVDLHIDPKLLERLVETIEEGSEPSTISFALDVLKGIIVWRELDEQVLVESNADDKLLPGTCNLQQVDPEQFDCTDLKCLCIKSLGHKWPSIMTRFDHLIKHNCVKYQSCILTFLSLWQNLVCVKSNFSISETEPFHMNLSCYVPLLCATTPAIVWKQLISLFNEVMCYGSTLSLQKNLECNDYPCKLAHMVVRSVKDRQLLSSVPIRGGGNDSFGGTKKATNDKVLLKQVVLMVLKSVAITVEETKYDSSCDSSSSAASASEMDDGDADMALIERSIHDVVKKLDAFMKTQAEFHPETKVAQWIVQVFAKHDEYLMESLLCCLDVGSGLCYRNNSIPELRRNLNPSAAFVHFLELVGYDPSLLLDYLISNETCFLLYLLRLLKHLRKNTNELMYACDSGQLEKVSTLVASLRKTIESIVGHKLFPYNIAPVLKKLKQCEEAFRRCQ